MDLRIDREPQHWDVTERAAAADRGVQMIHTERKGDVFVTTMDDGENRFNATSVAALHDALDAVEAAEPPRALVVTGTDKFFTNGLDLDWMGGAAPGEAGAMLRELERLFGRVLAFPAPTVAAINGHAFGAGAMFVQCFDRRIMRTERGYFCLPEADLGMTFSAGMNALLKARLDPSTAHEAMLTAKRYGADDALDRRIVDQVAPVDELVEAAVAEASLGSARDGEVLRALKRDLYAPVLDALAG
jgi:enoyl-CoA hydratase/carnithine racemase